MNRRLATALATTSLLVVALAGCGQSETPADAVPGLADQLARVDAAVAAGDADEARAALRSLVDLAEEAEADGDLDQAAADRIQAAAARLLARLPDGAAESTEPTESAEPTETPEPTEELTSDEELEEQYDEEEDKAKEEKDEKEEHGKAKGHDDDHGHD